MERKWVSFIRSLRRASIAICAAVTFLLLRSCVVPIFSVSYEDYAPYRGLACGLYH